MKYLLVSSFNGGVIFQGTEKECEERLIENSVVIPECNYENYLEYLQDQYENQI
jgi:hypothetical protein